MRVYIAAPVTEQSRAALIAERLEKMGFEVTSRWLYMKVGYDVKTRDELKANSQIDLDDVDSADMLVHLAVRVSFGASAEFGYALARGKKVLSWGKFLGIFQCHPNVEFLETDNEDALFNRMEELRGNQDPILPG